MPKKTIISVDLQNKETERQLGELVADYADKMGINKERAQTMYLRYLIRRTHAARLRRLKSEEVPQ